MEGKHRRIFVENKEELAKVIDLEALLKTLGGSGIFTTAMLDDIKNAGPTEQEKKDLLLYYMPKRGPEAFNKFFGCLVDSGHLKAARLLNNVMPDTDVWSGHVTSANTGKFKDNSIYRMASKPRGYALILSYTEFDDIEKLSCRHGGQVDETNLTNLFEQLGFVVVLERNMTHQQTTTFLNKYKNDIKHKDYDCFILTILSHGSVDGFYCRDGRVFLNTHLFRKFNNSECPFLIKKPKIFFLQYCRGDKDNHAIPIPLDLRSRLSVGKIDSDAVRISEDNDVNTDAVPVGESFTVTADDVGEVSDTIKCFSTLHGYVSIRSQVCGTIFISFIVEIFSKHAHKKPLDEMMQMVANEISKITCGTKKLKQATDFRLEGHTKKLYFFPGIYEEIQQKL